MSGIVLSASVRQNLLSLQSTAALLATTQNDLSTGTRSTRLSTIRRSISPRRASTTVPATSATCSTVSAMACRILQAANTGITSLQSLVASAQSIANQVLQSPVGYSPKSNFSSAAIPGATAGNLLGPGSNNTVTGAAIPGATATTTKLSALTTAITTADSLTIDGKTISFTSSGGNAVTRERRVARPDQRHGGRFAHGHRHHHRRHHRLDAWRDQADPEHRHHRAAGDRRQRRHADGARPDRRHDAAHASGAERPDPDDRRHRWRHSDQHRLRDRHRPGIDAQRAQRGAGGQQPSGRY